MTTTNPRINITVQPEIAMALQDAAKREKVSLSQVAARLLAWAIEEHEDMYFSKIADEIDGKNVKWTPNSDKIWK